MAVNLSPIWGAGAQLLDNSGNVLSGGKIYTYAAGTTTQVTTFTDGSGVTAHSNPIILNSAGRVPYEIWLTDGQNYKFVLKDSNDVLIGTWDNLSGINSNFIAYTNQQEIQTATAGQTVFNLTTMNYLVGTNSLSVFVDGVNQYGPGAQYAYEETDSNTVTFASGLHVGAEVKFTSSQIQNAGAVDASQVSFTGFKNQEGSVQDLAGDDGSDWIGFTQSGTGTVAVSAQDKMRQYVSVEDFGAVGDGVIDDAIGWRNAISFLKSNGGGVLYAPNSNYYFKSYVTLSTAIPAITWQNDPCVLLDGCNNIVFNCGNTTIHVDNSIASSHPNTSGATTFGFNNCVNISGNLPIIEGNRTGLPSNKFNNGIWLESCININFNELKFIGDFDNGSCVAGGHLFDSYFNAIYAENTSFCVDATCLENVTFNQIIVVNPAATFVSGFNCFLDAASYSYNVTGRNLISGMSSNVIVNSISADGADTIVRLDGIDGAFVNVSAFSGIDGISIATTSATNAIGKITKNIKITGTIRNLSGHAVLMDTGGYGLEDIAIYNLRVTNCAQNAIDYSTATNIGFVQVNNCDFTGQTVVISDLFAQTIGTIGGKVINNINYNPKGYIPQLLPAGTGSVNTAYNQWPFPVQVTINTTGAEFVTHVITSNGYDLDLGTVQAKGSITVTLQPTEGIYFTAALPSAWQWRGQ